MPFASVALVLITIGPLTCTVCRRRRQRCRSSPAACCRHGRRGQAYRLAFCARTATLLTAGRSKSRLERGSRPLCGLLSPQVAQRLCVFGAFQFLQQEIIICFVAGDAETRSAAYFQTRRAGARSICASRSLRALLAGSVLNRLQSGFSLQVADDAARLLRRQSQISGEAVADRGAAFGIRAARNRAFAGLPLSLSLGNLLGFGLKDLIRHRQTTSRARSAPRSGRPSRSCRRGSARVIPAARRRVAARSTRRRTSGPRKPATAQCTAPC